jgi:phospholipase/lecithinase/hemolysin
VADIAAQAAQLGPLTGFELVTVLAGANDILEQYARYPGVSEAQLTAELEATGAVLADQVNAIANAGGKVLIATVPDLGLSPFAIAQRADPANADTDRAALLSRLTGRFNAKLRANIINDGRRIGLLLADEVVQTVVKFPSTYGYVNVVAPACLDTAPLPTCNTATLQPASGDVAAAASFSWLWADATHLSPGGHNQLGALAATRAAGNPF